MRLRQIQSFQHRYTTSPLTITVSKEMGDIAKQYGLDLNGAWNKAAMPHLGKHPNVYHEFALKGMQDAAAGGNQANFCNFLTSM